MKLKTKLTLIFMFALLVFPLVSADIFIPTITNVYFEQNGRSYNGNIEFTVKGWGYTTGIPSDPVFNPNREPGTQIPEVVFSFSATYNNYGDKIYENYYRNYVHIDYYELEGKTGDGRKFVIRNIKEIPTSEEPVISYSFIIDGKYYIKTDRYINCMGEIRNYVPIYGPAKNEPVGAKRVFGNNTWTKQKDGMWTSPKIPEVRWGDILVDEQEGGVAYVNSGRAYDLCNQYLEEVLESEIEKDKGGNPIERRAVLKFNLDDAEWTNREDDKKTEKNINNEEPVKYGFWSKIRCFFKRLFGGSC